MSSQLEKERIKDRVPTELLDKILYTRDFSKDIENHLQFIKIYQEHPIETYTKLKTRLEKEGNTASFPEFIGVVGYCIKELFQSKENQKIIKENKAVNILIEEFKYSLMSIFIENRYYFPYRITIEIIEQALHFLDMLARLKNPNLPNYYHTVRYHTYLHYLIDLAPNGIVIPTFAELDIVFFIKTRCVPMYVCGITAKDLFVDMYHNTPLEFFIHDVGHSRRLHQESEYYYDEFIKNRLYHTARSPFDLISRETYYKEQYLFSKKILKLINKTKNKEKKKIKTLIVFEVIHEQSSPLLKSELCRRIQMSYDKFPIEKFTESKDHFIKMVFKPSADPTTLSHLYHKLVHGFFDLTNKPNENLLDKEYRNIDIIASVALEFLEELKCGSKLSLNNIKRLIRNTRYANEYVKRSHIKNKTMKKKKSKSLKE